LPQVNTHPSPYAGDIAGYRTFVAIVSVNYFTLIALTPRAWGTPPPFWQLVVISVVLAAFGDSSWRSGSGACGSRSSTCWRVRDRDEINGMAPGGLLP
jgi:hypothetical protein